MAYRIDRSLSACKPGISEPMNEQPKGFRFNLAKLFAAVAVCAVAFWLATNLYALMVAVIDVATLGVLGTALAIAMAMIPDDDARPPNR